MATKKQRGRPALPKAERKRNNVTLRLRDELRDRLVKQGQLNQRSLSEEMEARLEQSFAPLRLLDAALALRFGEPFGEIVEFIGACIEANARSAQLAYGKNPLDFQHGDWIKDPVAYRVASLAALTTLEALDPHGRLTSDDRAKVTRINDELKKALRDEENTLGFVANLYREQLSELLLAEEADRQ